MSLVSESKRPVEKYRYRGLLEAAPDAIVVVNEGGDIIFANLEAQKQFGYRRDEFVGLKIQKIIPEGFADRLLADDLRSKAEALARMIGAGIELTGRRKDGSEFPIEIMLSLLNNAEGILVTAGIRDITARKAAEAKLLQMENRYRGVLEAAPDAMVVVNRNGEIVLLNLQAERHFGYKRDELLGQNVTNIIPAGYAEELTADAVRLAETALDQRFGRRVELTGRRKDGSEFPIEIMLSSVDSGEGRLVTAAIRDIGERKKMERRKDEFVATVSHELRTPLTSISSALALLVADAAGELPLTATKLLVIAHNNSQRLVRLVNDILEIEKLESGKMIFDLKRVGVRSLLEKVIEADRAFAMDFGVNIRLMGASPECFVLADPDRLEQVVTNLISNAVRFSPKGADVDLAVETRDGLIHISVRDHGPGVPANFKKKIFEKFTQADNSDARSKGGTGLGLSIVKQIAMRLDGDVAFDDAPGGGTVFTVDLPVWDGVAGAEDDLAADATKAYQLPVENAADLERSSA